MEKRLILAIALSILVLMTWSALVPKPHPIANITVADDTTSLAKPRISIPKEKDLAAEVKTELPSSLINKEYGKFQVNFIENLAAIKEVVFKAHQNYKFPLKYGFLLGSGELNFKLANSTPETVTFVHLDSQKKITKKFSFSNSSYVIELEIGVENLSGSPLSLELPLLLGALDLTAKDPNVQYRDIAFATQEKTAHFNGRKNIDLAGTKFLSIRDRYFCGILEPQSGPQKAFIKIATPQESDIGTTLTISALSTKGQIGHRFKIYLGPQDLDIVNSINSDWTSIIHYGTFDFIAQIIWQLLKFLYGLVHNWGWAIVILSLVVYAILYPLSLKQMRSMKEMQALQPHVEELRKLYKDNPQRLNKEVLELYREHKVNPLGGCLPLVLQMPIFFALYQVLMRSVALKGAQFLWIKDLSEPDRLFILTKSIPLIGNEINILPIIMAIGMFIQQKVSAVAASGTSAEQQKIMLIVFPVIFGFIFYRMPSGLVLYWFINSALMLIYQIRINRAK